MTASHDNASPSATEITTSQGYLSFANHKPVTHYSHVEAAVLKRQPHPHLPQQQHLQPETAQRRQQPLLLLLPVAVVAGPIAAAAVLLAAGQQAIELTFARPAVAHLAVDQAAGAATFQQ